MTRRSPLGLILVIVLVLVAGCAMSVASSGPSSHVVPTAVPTAIATPVTTPEPTVAPTIPVEVTVAPPASSEAYGSPPIARLAVEGGDPVEGQLGTYTWAGGGSDSPWLPGAPTAVAAEEPMTVTFEPVIGVVDWSARIVPAGANGPAGARSLGEGSGIPHAEAPAPGEWTLEVRVTFAGGMGAASYFWALSVS